ncbi:MAG: ImmA/IrrE family metallo-endopeptidase [Pelagimonas sp.]|jgi:hypothetical protein|nr:ImmA/IrrE family metallo-endopeptidase [Pelagimonas sp.]
MPRKHPSYPYVEVSACHVTDHEIEETIRDMLSQHPGVTVRDGGPLDPVCRAVNVDLEYSDIPNEVLLEVPLDRGPVIWLPRNAKPRHDRLAAATGIGHWILHIPEDRAKHPNFGIQALYEPSNPEAHSEARRFALALLMPEDVFESLWYEGKAHLVANTLNVPTASAYERARMLGMDRESESEDTPEEMDFTDPLGILAPKPGVRANSSP